jgi:ABC-type branched-subunit amino acid transport system permease subunit
MGNSKKWWASKAVWAGVIAILVAGYNVATVQFGLPAIPDFVFAILGAFGVYGRVAANTEIK